MQEACCCHVPQSQALQPCQAGQVRQLQVYTQAQHVLGWLRQCSLHSGGWNPSQVILRVPDLCRRCNGAYRMRCLQRATVAQAIHECMPSCCHHGVEQQGVCISLRVPLGHGNTRMKSFNESPSACNMHTQTPVRTAEQYKPAALTSMCFRRLRPPCPGPPQHKAASSPAGTSQPAAAPAAALPSPCTRQGALLLAAASAGVAGRSDARGALVAASRMPAQHTAVRRWMPTIGFRQTATCSNLGTQFEQCSAHTLPLVCYVSLPLQHVQLSTLNTLTIR